MSAIRKAEREHLKRVVEIGCIVCRITVFLILLLKCIIYGMAKELTVAVLKNWG